MGPGRRPRLPSHPRRQPHARRRALRPAHRPGSRPAPASPPCCSPRPARPGRHRPRHRPGHLRGRGPAPLSFPAEHVCHHSLWQAVADRIQRAGGPPVNATSVLRVGVQELEPGLVDAVAIVRRGQRVSFIALRLEAVPGRWEVIELLYRGLANRSTQPVGPGQEAAPPRIYSFAPVARPGGRSARVLVCAAQPPSSGQPQPARRGWSSGP
jgi:hypothetical protein